MAKRFIVELTDEERQELLKITNTGKAAAYKIKHANILLRSDANSDAWSDQQVAQALGCHCNTVANVRQRFVESGLPAAIERKQQETPSRQPLVDGEMEAKIIAVRCGSPPEGFTRWTLSLLADKLVELQIVKSICPETVRKTLKKTNCGLI